MSFTRTEYLDTLYSTTWQIRKPKVVQQQFKATPFWLFLNRKNHITYQKGGRFIEQRLSYAKNQTVKFISKGGKVSLDKNETQTVAWYTWKMAVVNITRYYMDDLQNMGAPAIENMVTNDLDIAKNSMIARFEEVLFEDGTGDSNQAFDGLAKLVPTTNTTGTVGGIDAAANDWWRNSAKDMTTEIPSVYLVKRMRTMYNDCGIWGEGTMRFPQIIMTTQAIAELYEDEALEIYHITNDKELIDLGCGHMAFKGMPIVWSPSCPAYHMWMLNMDDFYFIAHPSSFFEMTNWKQVPDQLDRFCQITVTGNFGMSNRRRSGVIYNINN